MLRTIVPGVIDGGQKIISLPSSAVAAAAARLMAASRVGAVLVVDDGSLRGIVTERDLVTRVLATAADPEVTTLASVMTADPTVIAPEATAASALDLMRRGHFRHLPVVAEGRLCGIVSVRDLYEAVRQALEEDLNGVQSFIAGEAYGAGVH